MIKYLNIRKRASLWFEFVERQLSFAWRNPGNLLFSGDDCHPTLYSFANNGSFPSAAH